MPKRHPLHLQTERFHHKGSGALVLTSPPQTTLFKAIEEKDKGLSSTKQAELLRDFVQNSYTELEGEGNQEL